MEKDKDGSVRAARIEKSKPTPLEDKEFRGLVIMMVIVMVCVFGMGIVGAAMMFWRVLG
jgi:hypothetical protein